MLHGIACLVVQAILSDSRDVAGALAGWKARERSGERRALNDPFVPLSFVGFGDERASDRLPRWAYTTAGVMRLMALSTVLPS